MEENQLIDDLERSGNSSLGLTEEGRLDLNKAGAWAMFLAVIGFLIFGISIIGGFGLFTAGQSGLFPRGNNTALYTGILIYFAFIVIFTIPVFHLFRFAQKAQTASRQRSATYLNDSISSLLKSFRWYGILVILFISFYLIMTIYAVSQVPNLGGT